MTQLRRCAVHLIVTAGAVLACRGDEVTPPDEREPGVYRLPVVFHVLHHGEPVGTGSNLSEGRILGQIRVLNEDFRRKPGTRGHNMHPRGADARIEFVLATVAPDGSPTRGIRRVNVAVTPNPVPPNQQFDHHAHYGYWDPERYINVWTMPLPEESRDIVLGMATGPETDLPGAHLLVPGEPSQAEGILINVWHLGETGVGSDYNLGRTLTHEMGHYLGLLHPWGGGDCDANDYVADTPPVSQPVTGCPTVPPIGCAGEPVMTENFMNYTTDTCMSVFTIDQIGRMHHVLSTSPRRSSLARSPAVPGA